MIKVSTGAISLFFKINKNCFKNPVEMFYVAHFAHFYVYIVYLNSCILSSHPISQL